LWRRPKRVNGLGGFVRITRRLRRFPPKPLPPVLQQVGRAPDTCAATIEYVGIDHGGPDILVPEEFLNGADIVSRLQKVRGKRVAKGMACRPLPESRLSDGDPHGLLVEVAGILRPPGWESQKTNEPSGDRCPAEGRGSSRAPEDRRRYLRAFRPRPGSPVRPPLALPVSAEVAPPYRRHQGSVKRCVPALSSAP